MATLIIPQQLNVFTPKDYCDLVYEDNDVKLIELTFIANKDKIYSVITNI